MHVAVCLHMQTNGILTYTHPDQSTQAHLRGQWCFIFYFENKNIQISQLLRLLVMVSRTHGLRVTTPQLNKLYPPPPHNTLFLATVAAPGGGCCPPRRSIGEAS